MDQNLKAVGIARPHTQGFRPGLNDDACFAGLT